MGAALLLLILRARLAPWIIVLATASLPFLWFIPNLTIFVNGATLLFAVLFIIGLVEAISRRSLPLTPLGMPIALALSTMVLTVLAADAPSTVLSEILYPPIWGAIVFYAIVWNVNTAHRLKVLTLSLFLGAVLVCTFSLATRITNAAWLDRLQSLGLLRLVFWGVNAAPIGDYALQFFNRTPYDPAHSSFGTFVNADYFGAWLVYPLCLSVSLLLVATKKWKAAGAVLALFLLANIILTLGRGAMLAASVAIAVMVLIHLSATKSRFLPLIVPASLVLLAGIAVLTVQQTTLDLLGQLSGAPSRFSLSTLPATWNLRVELWQSGLELFLRRPLLGWAQSPGITILSSGLPLVSVHAHDWYIETLIETGSVGLIAFWLIMTGTAVYLSTKAYLTARSVWIKNFALGVTGAFAGFMVDGIFNDSYRDIHVCLTFWLFLALASLGWKFASEEQGARTRIRLQLASVPVWLACVVAGLLACAIAFVIVFLTHPTYLLTLPAGLLCMAMGLVNGAYLPRLGQGLQE